MTLFSAQQGISKQHAVIRVERCANKQRRGSGRAHDHFVKDLRSRNHSSMGKVFISYPYWRMLMLRVVLKMARGQVALRAVSGNYNIVNALCRKYIDGELCQQGQMYAIRYVPL